MSMIDEGIRTLGWLSILQITNDDRNAQPEQNTLFCGIESRWEHSDFIMKNDRR